MGKLVSLFGVSCLLALSACGGSSPLTPTPAQTVSVLPVSLVPNSADLPIGGGSLELIIATAANNVPVTVTASGGTLSASAVRTNSEGRASVTWTGTSSATVTAIAEGTQTVASIRVALPPTPEPTPTPAPPTPGPTPSPLPDHHTVLGVVILQRVDDSTAPAITLTATVFVLDGSPVGPLTYAWDLDGNGSIDSTAAAPVRVFPTGRTPVTLTVKSTDGRTGSGTTVVFIQ